eukprot:3058290-Heterocapsa_arctica.AAC.1
MKRKPVGWLWTTTGPIEASLEGPNFGSSRDRGEVPLRLAAVHFAGLDIPMWSWVFLMSSR